MPSVSENQKRFMRYMAHDKEAAKEHGIDPEMAKEWVHEDQKKDAEDKKKSEAKKEDK